jgi:hypothetical protein
MGSSTTITGCSIDVIKDKNTAAQSRLELSDACRFGVLNYSRERQGRIFELPNLGPLDHPASIHVRALPL